MPTPDDKELLSGCLAGNRGSWDLFVERFSRLIHWSIRKTLEDTPHAGSEEILAEIFQTLFEKLLDGREFARLRDAESIRKYLSVAACRLTLDRLKTLARRRKSTFSLDAPLVVGEELSDLDGAEIFKQAPRSSGGEALERETARLVEKALGELSPKERTCVEFHYLDGKTHREIAEILDLPQDTVSSLLRRTKEKLRKDLEASGLGEENDG
jgi:RNA polymerase sigma-70 factor (ECF subfamily)